MAEQRHGRYRLVRELGRGGMGTVYEAVDEQLNRSVALKVLHPLLCAEPGLVARFAAEAKIAAQLDHPNIVPIYDVGASRGLPFMAMKLVRGASLQERLAQGGLAPAAAVEILRQVAGGLDHAHAAGVIHRDVKPGNVLIAEDGQVMVVDFGIASVYGATRHSLAEALVGTPEYMAPECVLGEEPTPASDIYALAVVAYEVFAGRRPFGGAPMAVLHAQAYEAPSMTGIAPPLQPVLRRGLAKDPLHRFLTATFLAQSLGEAVDRGKQTELASLAPTLLNLGRAIPGRYIPRRQLWLPALGACLVAGALFWLGGAEDSAGAQRNLSQRLPFLSPSSPPMATSPAAGASRPLLTPVVTPTVAPTATPAPMATVTPPPLATIQQIVSLGAGQTEQIRLRLLQGDRVSGSFLVSGGAILGIGSDVVFRVSGPEGLLLNVGRVEQQHKFQFSALSAGEHRLSLQNPSSITGRQIALMLSYPDRR